MDEPFDSTGVLRSKQRPPAQLVACYRIDNPDIRALFVEYFTERQTVCDYSSLKALAGMLLKLFWGICKRTTPARPTSH